MLSWSWSCLLQRSLGDEVLGTGWGCKEREWSEVGGIRAVEMVKAVVGGDSRCSGEFR